MPRRSGLSELSWEHRTDPEIWLASALLGMDWFGDQRRHKSAWWESVT